MSRIVAAVCVLAGCFAFVSGCTGSSPTSPSSVPSSTASLPESIDFIGANAPPGTTIRLVVCSDNWDFYSCFKGLQLTFSVRSNQNIELAFIDTEFLTSDGRACGYSSGEGGQPLAAGVVAPFRTTAVYLYPGCFDLLPLKMTRVLSRVRYIPNPRENPGPGVQRVPIELMKQEFSIDYTLARE